MIVSLTDFGVLLISHIILSFTPLMHTHYCHHYLPVTSLQLHSDTSTLLAYHLIAVFLNMIVSCLSFSHAAGFVCPLHLPINAKSSVSRGSSPSSYRSLQSHHHHQCLHGGIFFLLLLRINTPPSQNLPVESKSQTNWNNFSKVPVMLLVLKQH